MKTAINVRVTTQLRIATWSIRWGIAEILGRRPKTTAAKKAQRDRKSAGPLTKKQLSEMISAQTSKSVRKDALRTLWNEDDAPREKWPMQRRAADLLRSVLTEDSSIGSVANIGARVDMVSAHLAPKFPSVSFTSVDFQPALVDFNSHLPQAHNWTFRPGYAIHLLNGGAIQPDLIICTSTSVLFNAVELDAFIASAKSAGVRKIVLNEPWWPIGWTFRRPERIPVDDPICAGVHGNYHHNYIRTLERHGYAITLSRIELVDGENHSCLQIIATRPPVASQ